MRTLSRHSGAGQNPVYSAAFKGIRKMSDFGMENYRILFKFVIKAMYLLLRPFANFAEISASLYWNNFLRPKKRIQQIKNPNNALVIRAK